MHQFFNQIFTFFLAVSFAIHPLLSTEVIKNCHSQSIADDLSIFTQQAMALDAIAHSKPALGQGPVHVDVAAADIVRTSDEESDIRKKPKMWATQGIKLLTDEELPPDALLAIQQLRTYVNLNTTVPFI